MAAAATALALGAPAHAINDTKVPADSCSGNPNAVGTPGGNANPGLATADPVDAPASANNPGNRPGEPGNNEQGARGEANSQAPCNA